jgi:cystathionine gamma-lyase
MKFRTRAIHVGAEPDPATGAVVPPIHVASTFIQPGAGEWGKFDYSRSGSPTRNAVEQTLANLEGGFGALAFSSGMAATHCAVMHLEAGDHLVAGSDVYGGTYRLLHKIANRSNISVTLAPACDLEAFEAALRPNTKMVWLESIGNPLMSIPDMRQLVQLCKQRNILIAVDNTFATPALHRPIEWGADIVMHSATKYLAGHSDCLAGVLVTASESLFRDLYFVQNATGAVLGPFESFLLARGLKTLDLRVREQSRSALKVAAWLEQHPRVSRVIYPGLPSHPQHDLAAVQLENGFGGMISFETRGDYAATKAVCQTTKLFGLAVSLGAVESLIEQPASMSHASYDATDRAKFGIRDSLIRISIGLEDPDDLIADLDQALVKAGVT